MNLELAAHIAMIVTAVCITGAAILGMLIYIVYFRLDKPDDHPILKWLYHKFGED